MKLKNSRYIIALKIYRDWPWPDSSHGHNFLKEFGHGGYADA